MKYIALIALLNTGEAYKLGLRFIGSIENPDIADDMIEGGDIDSFVQQPNQAKNQTNVVQVQEDSEEVDDPTLLGMRSTKPFSLA